MDLVAVVVVAIWVMLPAYIPNNAAVVVGGGRPVDGGRTYRGARLLGDGKTWRGTVGGVVAGGVVAIALNALAPGAADWSGIDLPTFARTTVVGLPLGAMLGDMAASFLKRRLGRDRGASVPGLDQYDLVVGALGLVAVVDWPWLVDAVTPAVLVAILVLTPILHRATNVGAYLLGLKEVPW
ncbi:MAG: CDP-2,3-bis-(O-geranylgeranyl)-sn-glycerol synthase [Halobacteriales archaeon]